VGSVELLADGGAAATSDDLFRCAAYLGAERVTHTFRIAHDNGEPHVPLIVSEIEGGSIDAISPYGYPGGIVTGEPPDAGDVDWSESGLVSIFGRERLGASPWLADPPVRGRVNINAPAAPRQIRIRLAEQIRAIERDGWATDILAGPPS
jgi:hypothetical protein